MKFIKFIFSSLFSNKTVIDEHKKQPWWLAFVFVIVACIASIVPIFTSLMGTNGSLIVTNTTNYNIDMSLKQFSIDYLSNADNSLEIKDDQLNLGEKATIVDNVSEGVYLLHEVKFSEKPDLLVYYVAFDEEEAFNNSVNLIKASHRINETENTSYLYPTLILGKVNIRLMLYGKDAKCSYNVQNEIYTITSEPDGSTSQVMSGNYIDVPEELSNLNSFYSGKNDSEIASNAFDQWKLFLDKCYENPRNIMAWQYVGFYSLMDLGIILIMALVLFLLSRTKASVVKYSFLSSLKMVLFASLSPALISLLLGFLIPSLQGMSFLMCYILRITWLGMKATNPQQPETIRK